VRPGGAGVAARARLRDAGVDVLRRGEVAALPIRQVRDGVRCRGRGDARGVGAAQEIDDVIGGGGEGVDVQGRRAVVGGRAI
jgi:hypothetical protein